MEQIDRRKFIQNATRAGALAAAAPILGAAGQSMESSAEYTTPLISGKTSGPAAGRKPYICIFSKHVQWLGYKEMAKLLVELGFTGVDLTVRPGGHVEPENAKRDLPEAVKAIRGEGLEVPMIATGITDASDPLTKDILETAGKLGIGIYRTGYFRYDRGKSPAEVLKEAETKLAGLQKINEANNIAASYQNHEGPYFGSSGWDLLRVIEKLDPEWIGMQFDIRHATAEGVRTWHIILELLAPWINSMDIKDFTWRIEEGSARVQNTPLGEGVVDWEKYRNMVEKFGIQADYSIHYEYDLGGADHGHREITISREAFVKHVRADLEFFKKHML